MPSSKPTTKSRKNPRKARPAPRPLQRLRPISASRFLAGERATPRLSPAEELKRDGRLLTKIKRRLPALKKLLREANGFLAYEDRVYRFYHESFKVYALQNTTLDIVEALQALAPGVPLNRTFVEILAEGTNKKWEAGDNRRWAYETRPLLEAFFHARYFLEMACRYGQRLTRATNTLPSGWAAVLYLYDWR